MQPSDIKHQGSYKIEIRLDDGYSTPNKYKFKVTVEKDPNATIANKFKGF